MKFDAVVFDLDGTLWDTTPACAVAWNNVLNQVGVTYRTITKEDVRAVTGLPHDECIYRTFQDLPGDVTAEIVKLTAVEDNRVIEALGGDLYDGVAIGIERLSKTFPLAIVSNCQTGYIENFYRMHGLGRHFADHECFGNTRRPKGENLQMVMDRQRFKSPIMIGDALGDEAAARSCNVPFAFVSYGFGQAEAPDWTFEDFNSLTEFLIDQA